MNVELVDNGKMIWKGTLAEFEENNPGVLDNKARNTLLTCLEITVGGGAHGDFTLARTTSPEQDAEFEAMMEAIADEDAERARYAIKSGFGYRPGDQL